MSSYEYSFTWLNSNTSDHSIMKSSLFLGLRPLVIVSAFFSSIVRCILENPIEYAKVMGQVNKKWILRDVYRGFHYQILRTTVLIIPIFSMLDIFRRETKMLDTLYGNFIVTAGASAVSYFICWPLETLKNLTQSGDDTNHYSTLTYTTIISPTIIFIATILLQ